MDSETEDATESGAWTSSETPEFEVEGRFHGLRVIGELGRGGGGVVYMAIPDASPEEPVALKVLGAGGWATPTQLARFHREIALASSLNDPGLVPILTSGATQDGVPWYTMPIMGGTSLAALAKGKVPRPPWVEVARIVAQVAHTLDRLHARGIVHRDIKPGNILLTSSGTPLVSDLGLALPKGETRLTRQGRVLGTPAYMAPEQLSGAATDWRKVDIFALGRVLDELLSGEAPLHHGDQRTRPAPRALKWIAAVAMAPSPQDRPKAVSSIADWLDTWLNRPAMGAPLGVIAALVRTGAKRPSSRFAALGGGLTVASLALAAVLLSIQRERNAVAVRWQVESADASAAIAEGDLERATAILRSFAWDVPVEGAPERSLAHTQLRELALNAGDLETALSEGVFAVSTATTQERRGAAMERLLEIAIQTNDTALVERILLAHDAMDWGVIAPVNEARSWVSAARLDFDSPALTPSHRELLAPFRGATQVHLSGDFGGISWQQDPSEVVLATPEVQAPTRTPTGWQVPQGWRILLGSKDGPPVLVDPDLGLWVLGLEEAERKVERLPRPVFVAAWARGRLFLLTEGPSGTVWEVRDGSVHPALPSLDAQAWFGHGLRTVDVEGDGQKELLLTIGPPAGFLSAVLRPSPEGLEALTSGRTSYGYPVGVLQAREQVPMRVLTTRVNSHPDSSIFGAENPFGGHCGLVVLAAEGELLREVQELPFRRPKELCPHGQGATVDLDGDGLEEVLVHIEADIPNTFTSTLVYRQRPDGLLEDPVLLDRLNVMSLGEDGVLLFAHVSPQGEHSVWRTGEAGPGVPVTPSQQLFAQTAPCGQLQLALGLNKAAAMACERVTTEDKAERSEFLVAAASAWLRADMPEEARRAVERANAISEDFDHPMRAWAWQAAARHAPLRFGKINSKEIRGLLSDSLEWLDGFDRPTFSLRAATTLPEGLRILAPSAVLHAPLEDRLELRAPAGAGPLLYLPLRGAGGPTAMRFKAVLTRAEWASRLGIYLRHRGSSGASFTYGTFGVGDEAHLGSSGVCAHTRSLPSVEAKLTLEIELWWSQDGRELTCRSRIEDEVWVETTSAPPPPVAAEPWELVLQGESPYFSAAGQLMTIDLKELDLWGLEVDLDAPERADPWRAWAHSKGPLPAEDPERGFLAAMLRLDPGLSARLSEAYSADFARELEAQTWVTNAYAHPDEPSLHPIWLTLQLPEGLSQSQRDAFAIAQGSALAAGGELDEAVRLLEKVSSGPQEGSTWGTRLEARIQLAEVELSRGHPEAALQLITMALSEVPDADLARRLIRNRDRFLGLQRDPEWSFLWLDEAPLRP